MKIASLGDHFSTGGASPPPCSSWHIQFADAWHFISPSLHYFLCKLSHFIYFVLRLSYRHLLIALCYPNEFWIPFYCKTVPEEGWEMPDFTSFPGLGFRCVSVTAPLQISCRGNPSRWGHRFCCVLSFFLLKIKTASKGFWRFDFCRVVFGAQEQELHQNNSLCHGWWVGLILHIHQNKTRKQNKNKNIKINGTVRLKYVYHNDK